MIHLFFYRLPEWSIYVKTPHLNWNNAPLAGFWCHLEWDNKEKIPSLKLVLNTFKLQLITLPLDKTVLNGIYKPQKTRKAAREYIIPLGDMNYHASLFIMVSLVYFICKASAEISKKGKHPHKVQPKLFKGVFKLFPTNQPTLWNIDSVF